MNNQRIDIDKHRWMALRDGLFIYVRTHRRWSMDIIVAPWERVSVLRRSELPTIRTVPFVSYAALFGAPVFAICALVMLAANRDTPLQSLGWALGISIALTVVLSGAMLLAGRVKGRRETVLYASCNFTRPLIRFKHDEGANLEMDAFLDALPTRYGTVSDAVPLGEWYRLPAPVRSVLGMLYLPLWIVTLLPRTSENDAFTWIFQGAFMVMAAMYLVLLAWQLHFFYRNPKATKEARAALLDGDYGAAELILRGVLEKSPRQPYANHLQTAVALVNGDLPQAAACSAIVEQSRIMQYLLPPFPGAMAHAPASERLRALAAWGRGVRGGRIHTAGPRGDVRETIEHS
jgi:hypothetical protein